MENKKKFGLDQILAEIKSRKSPAQISNEFNIPKQTLSYSLGKLKKMGCIEKVGYGTWEFIREVPIQPKGTSEVKTGLREIRGHAFIWTIEFTEGYDWKQIVENFKRKYPSSRLTFKKICNKKVNRTIFKSRKIWLTKRGLTIYESLDFLDKSSFTVKGQAVFEMDRLIKDLLKKLNLKIQPYTFNCSREHFAHVKNQMARQFNDEKKKLFVEYNGKHFWIDHSHRENEEETDDANTSVQAQNFYKSQMKTGFAVTPEVVLDGFKESAGQIEKAVVMIGQNAKNVDFHMENMRSHVGATKDLSAAAVDLKNGINELMTLIRSKL